VAIVERVKNAWNAFRFDEKEKLAYDYNASLGPSTSIRLDRTPSRFYNERSIVGTVLTRMSMDVAGAPIRHIKVDDLDRYQADLDTAFNTCLTLQPNLDQGPRAFRQDIAMTMFTKGVAAIVPVDTQQDPTRTERFDIHTLRVGEIVGWYPRHVKVDLYNIATGLREHITLEKKFVAIVENPLFAIMNEPNSTLQRLMAKLAMLDNADELASSGKLDLIIQLPYVVKSEARRQQAEQRRADIELQLKGSQYGIAYTDGTEKITQLNRPAENNLLKQVEYLTKMFFSQLGITEEILNGSADEKTMTNYYNRTVEPVLDAIVEAMQRSFLGFSGTEENERVRYFRSPFKLVPVNDMAEIADKFTRNEILTSNEIRGAIGIAPSNDPKADQLVNSNMPAATPTTQEAIALKGNGQNGS
jgi:hypothetical protein